MTLFQYSWLTAPGSPEAFLLHTLSGMMHLLKMQPCVSNLISDLLEKQKKGRFMSIICQMTWNDQFSIFKSGTEPILSAPLSTFVNLAPTFASTFASWIQIRPLFGMPIHQTKARTDFNNLLFVPLPIWDNNGHLALRQCSTNYIVGVVNFGQLVNT